MDSTIRCTLSGEPPLDFAVYRRDALKLANRHTIGADDDYFRMVRSTWRESLRHAFRQLPGPPWG